MDRELPVSAEHKTCELQKAHDLCGKMWVVAVTLSMSLHRYHMTFDDVYVPIGHSEMIIYSGSIFLLCILQHLMFLDFTLRVIAMCVFMFWLGTAGLPVEGAASAIAFPSHE